MIKHPPLYPFNEQPNAYWSLYSQDYYYWNLSCDSDIFTNKDSLISLLGISKNIFIFTDWIYIVWGFSIFINLFVYRHIRIFIKIGSFLMIIYLFSSMLKSTIKYYELLNLLLTKQCFDTNSQETFKEYSLELQSKINLMKAGIIISMFSILPVLKESLLV